MSLPYLLPEAAVTNGDSNQHGYQGIGAQAVNHLANKLTIALFPPQRSFYKLELNDEARAKVEASGSSEIDMTEQLVNIEKQTQTIQEKINSRAALSEIFKNLIVSGNVLMYMPEDGNLQAISLNHYVVRRANKGTLLEVILLEEMDFETLEEETKAALKDRYPNKYKQGRDDKVKLYTRSKRTSKTMFEVTQSIEDVPLGTPQRIKEEKLLWIPLRWNSTYGENYGRGLIEDHSGDFFVVEMLSEAIAKGAVLMSDIKYLVKQGSTIDIDHLIDSPTGEFIYGNRDDIGVLQIEKQADFTTIASILDKYEKRIGQAFMLGSANRRDAERVTAVELRLDAMELETSLGGIYSHLSQSLQRPFAFLLLQRVSVRLGARELNPVILTGLGALGRSGDLEKINQFTQMMQLPTSWPEAMQARVKWGEFSRTIASSLSLELGWLKSDEDLAKDQEAQQQAQAEQMALQEASKAIPDVVKDQLNVGGKDAG